MFSNLTSYIFGSKSEEASTNGEALDANVAAPEEVDHPKVKKQPQPQPNVEDASGDLVLVDEDDDDGEIVDEGESK